MASSIYNIGTIRKILVCNFHYSMLGDLCSCTCYYLLTIPSNFYFRFIFFCLLCFFYSFSVLIPKFFHCLYLYLFSYKFQPVHGLFLVLFDDFELWVKNQWIHETCNKQALGSALKTVKLSEKHYTFNTGEYHLEKIVYILSWSFSFKL